MKLSVVISCVDTPILAETCTKYLRENSNSDLTEIILNDNGSYEPLDKFYADRVVRFEKNVGGNAAMHDILPHLHEDTEIVAFLHCDLLVREKDWDKRVLAAFDEHENMALLGFVGSYIIDELGGRGWGTTLNFLGADYPKLPAKLNIATQSIEHGLKFKGLTPAAVLDHCSLVFRLSVFKDLPPQRGNYGIGHFYDRGLCCEVHHIGMSVAVLGISVDHLCGGIADGWANALELYKEWLLEHGVTPGENPDHDVYFLSEQMFFSKWKPYIPFRVNKDWTITRL